MQATAIQSSSGPGEEIPCPILIDLDPSDGNQGLKLKGGVRKGDTVKVQFFADSFPEVAGYGLTIEVEEVLKYVEKSFVPSDFIPNGTGLPKGGIH